MNGDVDTTGRGGPMALENELAVYHRELPNLLPDEGKYVLIHGNAVAGVWETYEDALKAGYERFSLKPFLVKKIQGVEQIQFFSRDMPLCQS